MSAAQHSDPRLVHAQLHKADLTVLALIGGGLIGILLAIIAGLFFAKGAAALPNWAENVLVGTATAAALKLGDVLAALVSLANNRQIGVLGRIAAQSKPPIEPPPADAVEGARTVAEAADRKAEAIATAAEEPLDLKGAELPEARP